MPKAISQYYRCVYSIRGRDLFTMDHLDNVQQTEISCITARVVPRSRVDVRRRRAGNMKDRAAPGADASTVREDGDGSCADPICELLTTDQVVDRLLIDANLRRAAATCVLPAVRCGSTWRFRNTDLEEWIRRQKSEDTRYEAGLNTRKY